LSYVAAAHKCQSVNLAIVAGDTNRRFTCMP